MKKEIADNTIQKANQESVIADAINRFYFEAIEILSQKYCLSLKILFAVDVDETTLTILRCKVISKFDKLNAEIINALSTNVINRNALIRKPLC